MEGYRFKTKNKLIEFITTDWDGTKITIEKVDLVLSDTKYIVITI